MPRGCDFLHFPLVRVLEGACIPPLSGRNKHCKCTDLFSKSYDIKDVLTEAWGLIKIPTR